MTRPACSDITSLLFNFGTMNAYKTMESIKEREFPGL